MSELPTQWHGVISKKNRRISLLSTKCLIFCFYKGVWNIVWLNKYLVSYAEYVCRDTGRFLQTPCMLLLFNFNQNYDVSINCSRTLPYNSSWKSIQHFSSFYTLTDRWMDRRTERQADRHKDVTMSTTVANFHFNVPKERWLFLQM
jgi:hypothetical protein